ncbi:hypothetical protein [Paraburkholderia sp. C35]|uniref:hypothetical protein n=1 Tax=Paraburkholderia sp. C35 TaxID=2126993 RepID=UPI0013A55E87|nr:hypothetical protein [Paraburkholderia sp. C35]
MQKPATPMLTAAYLAAVTEAAKANRARLDACTSHVFTPILPGSRLRQRYVCANCAGEVDSASYRFYAQGREHEARK